MSAQTIILIRDRENPELMEFLEFTEPKEAERYLEQLLTDGVEPEAVRVFDAQELDMRVSHRPVVSLNSTGGTSQSEAEAEEAAPTVASSEVQADPATQTNGAGAAPAPEVRDEPFIRDGVRFSELFKPAG